MAMATLFMRRSRIVTVAMMSVEAIDGLTRCEVCTQVAPNETHPCSFEQSCSCWYGSACNQPLPAFDAHDERVREVAQKLINGTQRRLDNAL